MYFSIAPQTVVIPDGPTLCFQVNPANTALVEIAMTGEDADGNQGTHILTFNRNGGPASTEFFPESKSAPLDEFGSVDDDAVRLAPEPTPPAPSKPTPPAPSKPTPPPPAKPDIPPAPKPADKVVTSSSLDASAPP